MGAQLDRARRRLAAVTAEQIIDRLEQETATLATSGPAIPSTRSVGARWWCSVCFAFVVGETSTCARCRHAGPHDFGEESNAPGFKQRRDRLKRERKKRRR